MKIDKESGAPQFSRRDLVACGTRLPSYKDGPVVIGVTVCDVNLWLRSYARKMKAKKHNKPTKGTK